jgi:putative oxidoreductase
MSGLTAPLRRYLAVTLLSLFCYAILNIAAMSGALDGLSSPVRLSFAALVALPIAVQIWATLVAMRDSDEYLRAIMARRFIIAAGAAFAIFSAWGLAESYAGAPHAPGWLVYPLFWASYGLVTPFVRSSL